MDHDGFLFYWIPWFQEGSGVLAKTTSGRFSASEVFRPKLFKKGFFFFLVCLSELGMNCLRFVPNKSIIWNRWNILQHKYGLENGQRGDVFCLQSGLALI